MKMSDWLSNIIDRFRNQESNFIFVHDYDLLLSEETILNELTKLGYDVIHYEDSIAFRYLYEQQYRGKEKTYKLLVFTNDESQLPYEFQKMALTIKLNIKTIFPKFSARIIRQLNRDDFDKLYEVHAKYQGTPTDSETLEYLVKHFYKIPYELIESEAGLYKILLLVYYGKNELPKIIQNHLLERWRQIPAFHSLPLNKLLASSASFYQYLEQKWAELIQKVSSVKKVQINESNNDYKSHPFANHDVRRLINDLFLEGILNKVKVEYTENIPDWMYFGIEELDKNEVAANKLEHIKKKILDKLPQIDRYKDWVLLAELLAEYKHISFNQENESYIQECEDLFCNVNRTFETWMLTKYHTLTSLPPYPKAKLVHHIPQVICNERKNNEKVALLVLDGMSYSQWRLIRQFLKGKNFLLEEHGVFAWVPTLTSVSRQAIFSGNIPLAFSQTIQTTSSEEKLWKTFWGNHGVLKQYVRYQKGLGKGNYERKGINAFSSPSIKIYGAVIDIIDQFSHHAVLGEKGIVANILMWLESNYLNQMLTDLIDAGFTVFLTSDHGNTQAKGIGRLSEGVLVDQKGERVRVYRDETIYQDSAARIPSIKWPNTGLPDDYFVLLAKYRQAFVNKGEDIVTHGGISIEEVIVPFVKVERKKEVN